MTDPGVRTWSTRPQETLVAAVGALVMVGLGFTVDAQGKLLVWLGAAILAALALSDRFLTPRLRADEHGLTARTLTARASAPWVAVEVTLRETRRFGRPVRTLELDLGERFVVFGRRELGTDPAEVAEELTARTG